jgi:hypothetical protein
VRPLLAATLLALAAPHRAAASDAAPAAAPVVRQAHQERRDGGEVDPRQLQSLAQLQHGAIQDCYEEGLRGDAALHGKLLVRFTLLETGAVGDVEVAKDGLRAPGVTACIVGAVRSWSTPLRPSAPVVVELPLSFSVKRG